MKKIYKEWINKNYPTPQSALNQCYEACKKMNQKFPELLITNGLIQVGIEPEERQHWWLKTLSGEIIDPTEHQYQVFGMNIVFYNEIDNEHDLRKFEQCKCIYCGTKFFLGKNDWNNRNSCSNECVEKLENYYNVKKITY